MSPSRRTSRLLLVFLVSLLLAAAFWYFGRRPARQPVQQEWFQGIVYERIPLTAPRPILIHLVTIDLTEPGIAFLTNPPDRSGGMEMVAQTVGYHARQYEAQLAINASFFYPFHSTHPFDYYPHKGDPVFVRGPAIAFGEQYSDDNPDSPMLCIRGRDVQILMALCPAGTEVGLGSVPRLVWDGKADPLDDQKLAPRTAVALDAAGTRMWLILVDGRQPGYSDGMTLAELATFSVELGAERGINFDGGGSSTLIANTSGWYFTANAPIHTRIPMRTRPIANILGVYAEPVE